MLTPILKQEKTTAKVTIQKVWKYGTIGVCNAEIARMYRSVCTSVARGPMCVIKHNKANVVQNT